MSASQPAGDASFKEPTYVLACYAAVLVMVHVWAELKCEAGDEI